MRASRRLNSSLPALLALFSVACVIEAPPPPAELVPDLVISQRGRIATPSLDVYSTIARNQGSFKGTVQALAPGIVARWSPTVDANLGKALVNASRVNFRQLLQTSPSPLVPIANARVVTHGLDARPLSEPADTGAQGQFQIAAVRPSEPLVILKTQFRQDNQQIELLSVAPAPREPGVIEVPINPATTLVAKKVLTVVATNALNPLLIRPSLTSRLATVLGGMLNEPGLVAAMTLRDDRVAELFDVAFAALPANQREELTRQAANLGSAALLQPSIQTQVAGAPTAPPTEPPLPFALSSAGATATGGTSASGSVTVKPPAGTPTTVPDPSPPRVTIRTLGRAFNGARVEVRPGQAEVLFPSFYTMETTTLEALDEAVVFSNLDRAVHTVCYELDDRYELTEHEIQWEGGSTPIFGRGKSLFSDMAVRGGVAYLTSTETNNIMQVVLNTGVLSVFAGRSNYAGGMRDGSPSEAEFLRPTGILATSDGLYVADSGNNRIRKVTYAGVVSTLAGGRSGAGDGAGALASFQTPSDLTRDAEGLLYVADRDGHRIRRITPQGVVTTITGSTPGNTDGQGAAATLQFPVSIGHGVVAGSDVLVVVQNDGLVRLLRSW
ncbi:MAG: hypothetical protein VKP62_00480 [Candidatus Sericytochromatia bacterium]|nr:hypothetical protein [Candidatus Sericytochromatia bacterium]